MKLVTSSLVGWWWWGGWTKTKLMLFSNQVEVVVELKLELSFAKSRQLIIKRLCTIYYVSYRIDRFKDHRVK